MQKFKKLLTVFLAASFLLSACGKASKPAQTDTPTAAATTADPNVPLNTVRNTDAETEPAITDIPDFTSGEPTEADETSSETEGTESSETVTDTEPVTEPEELPEPEYPEGLPETKAMDALKLFNSNRVHAKYIAAQSFDGEVIVTTSVEYFIDGSTRVYTINSVKRIIQGSTITVIDNDNKFYMVYEGAYEGLKFGFDLEDYKLVSQTDNEEVYEIEGQDVTSTWQFTDTGYKISDRSSDGSFILYDVEALDTDFSDMETAVPPNYKEVDADDYEMYK